MCAIPRQKAMRMKAIHIPYTWENFGVEKNWRIEGHSPIFICQCFFLGSVLTIHAAHAPIFYPLIDLDLCIRQCFTLPKFSHVRYSYTQPI